MVGVLTRDSPDAQPAPPVGTHRQEWSLREPCSSAEGGAGACSILASTDRPVRSNRAGGATSAFLKSDRRDLPEADERNGDDPITRPNGAGLVLRHACDHQQRGRRAIPLLESDRAEQE
jgi:hypothetical protein